jgi:hypothetical protein
METANPINIQALKQLKQARPYLTPQQYRTIRGQILAGHYAAALKGLENLLQRRWSGNG